MIEYKIPRDSVIFEEEIKKSRFITYLQHTNGLDEAKVFWQHIKNQHPNARHHCWAAVAGAPDDWQQLGFSDDGEPSGTAGKPMLATLQGSQVGEISAVVVRYFGGILLGTGGLVRAYANGVQQALTLLNTDIKVKRQLYFIKLDYTQIGWLQQLCEQYDVSILNQHFTEHVQFQLGIREDKFDIFENELLNRSNGQLKLERE
ncbi:YigZ family protein [[Haemophilus] felis]|nr:YigZ family protein [[Haemophilus] felis]